MRQILLIMTVLALSGCMTTSDVIPTGPDTYMVTTAACPACGGSSKAMTMALKKAASYCTGLGKVMLRKGFSKENLNFAGAGGSTLEFRCLESTHPDYQRADGRRESNIIIEHR
ncbi:hypothetical protein [Endozoicomonas arenosclerae]|uniref:hypothetical protein n=1 Tax=Endozoicomonas arenosclerae TaxID=1633495 RepID=UPI0007847194|nr:hypothetical protein [Endozoicomonas arenosclerae]